MTNKQWDFLNAEISSMKVCLFAVAKAFPNQAALRAVFLEQKEIAETTWLNTQLSEESLKLKQRKLADIESVLFG